MKTPTWGYVVGILLMLFGGCGGMKNVQYIATPTIMEKQNEMFKAMSEGEQPNKRDTLNVVNADSSIGVVNKPGTPLWNKNMAKAMGNVFNMTDYEKKWIVRLGYIGFIPTFIYMLAGAFLLIRRRFSIKLAYGALVLSILFAITRIAVLMQGSPTFGLVALTVGGAQLFGIVIDIIFIIVIAVSDKSAYLTDSSENNTAPLL